MKIKLDENLSRHLKPVLTEAGHDAATAAEEGLLARSDRDIGTAAKKEGRMVFTLDLEFADLREHRPGDHPGIVVFRPKSFGPLAVNRFVKEFVRDTDLSLLAGCVAIVEPTRVRVRRPPLDTTTEEWTEVPIE